MKYGKRSMGILTIVLLYIFVGASYLVWAAAIPDSVPKVHYFLEVFDSSLWLWFFRILICICIVLAVTGNLFYKSLEKGLLAYVILSVYLIYSVTLLFKNIGRIDLNSSRFSIILMLILLILIWIAANFFVVLLLKSKLAVTLACNTRKAIIWESILVIVILLIGISVRVFAMAEISPEIAEAYLKLPVTFVYTGVLSILVTLLGVKTSIYLILNLILQMIAAWLAYCIARKVCGRIAGIIALLICALLPCHVFYSVIPGAQPLFACFLLGTVYLCIYLSVDVIKAWQNPLVIAVLYLLLGALMLVSIYINPMALICLIALIVGVFAYRREWIREQKNTNTLLKVLNLKWFKSIFFGIGFILTGYGIMTAQLRYQGSNILMILKAYGASLSIGSIKYGIGKMFDDFGGIWSGNIVMLNASVCVILLLLAAIAGILLWKRESHPLLFIVLLFLSMGLYASFVRNEVLEAYFVVEIPIILAAGCIQLLYEYYKPDYLPQVLKEKDALESVREISARLDGEEIMIVNSKATEGDTENAAASEVKEGHIEKKTVWLDNPLPVPKKPQHKSMDYMYSVSEEKMHYDIEIEEKDDFEI